MNLTRQVVLDLLPVYLAGDASPDTRALVEQFAKQDPEVAALIERGSGNAVDALHTLRVPAATPELGLRSLTRTRRLIAARSWLLGLALAFTGLSFSSSFKIENGHLSEFHFLARDLPEVMLLLLGAAAFSWIGYFWVRRRLRTSQV